MFQAQNYQSSYVSLPRPRKKTDLEHGSLNLQTIVFLLIDLHWQRLHPDKRLWLKLILDQSLH